MVDFVLALLESFLYCVWVASIIFLLLLAAFTACKVLVYLMKLSGASDVFVRMRDFILKVFNEEELNAED